MKSASGKEGALSTSCTQGLAVLLAVITQQNYKQPRVACSEESLLESTRDIHSSPATEAVGSERGSAATSWPWLREDHSSLQMDLESHIRNIGVFDLEKTPEIIQPLSPTEQERKLSWQVPPTLVCGIARVKFPRALLVSCFFRTNRYVC